MFTLTHSELLQRLSNLNGAAPVGIVALTDAKALKTNNPFPNRTVMKQVRAVGFVGANYEAAVKREGERQGAEAAGFFVAASLPWGKWEIPHKVISHKGALYLRTQTTPGQRNRQPAKVLAYRDTAGKFLSRDEVKPFLPAPSYSVKQGNVGIGEDASEQVMVRTYAFSSLRKIRLEGITYNVVPDEK